MRGPELHVLSIEPADGAGLDCDPVRDDCGVPTDTAITLRFDRFLLPQSAIRQSLAVYTGVPSNPALPASNRRAEPTPRYDLVERSVRYVFPPGFRLQPKTLYTIELPVYTEPAPFGFRAFDGAPLEGPGPLRFAFFTGSGPSRTPAVPLAPPGCDDVEAALFPCASSGCHGAPGVEPAPRMGLSLSDWDALEQTAISRPAHQTEIGDTTGVVNQAPPRFGVNMPLIDPERPDNSYLLYKLLSRPEAYQPRDENDCTESAPCVPPDPAELERMRAWFLRGEPMPAVGENESHVFHAELTTIQAFIAAGARCSESTD